MANSIDKVHLPVMLNKALACLRVNPGLIWVDATVGAGGHLQEIIRETGGLGTIAAIDRDAEALAVTRTKLAQNPPGPGTVLHLVKANYRELETVLFNLGIARITGGVLADLGASSLQLDNPARGFSFQQEGPLDMRMDQDMEVTAEQLVNTLTERQLADLIFQYGEERLSRVIARKIVKYRPLHTTSQLSSLITSALGRYSKSKRYSRKLHFATRTFQSLRIAVNNELNDLEVFLRAATKLLAPGARIVIITFHSLEDRVVKHIFRRGANGCCCPLEQTICGCDKQVKLKILTVKPLLPDVSEVLANPRSRSAKLRAAERIA